MCFAIPGKILETWHEGPKPLARADFAGEIRTISIAFLPDLQVGDYTIVHAGQALSKIAPEQVDEVMASMLEAGIVDEEGLYVEGGALL